MTANARFLAVLACFLLSGAAALIYQTAWTRQFAFVFGTSELAVATVLAAYMGGLAAGAAIAGRLAHRVTRPILVYGLIELGIALCALAVPLGIELAQRVYVALFSSGGLPGEGGLTTALFYLVCSFVILFPATALMGATLPLLARYAVRSEAEIGSRIGALYTANTVGAVAGTAVAGFVLLPRMILGDVLLFAVGGNALVFLIAAGLARGTSTVAASDGRPAPRGATERTNWILPLIAVSGCVSFLYEVLWTRLLGNLLGGSVYAFATMLATFLAGIAIGSSVAALLASSRERSVRGFAIAQIGTAACALAAFVVSDQLPELARSLGRTLGSDVALCALVLLPSTIFIGATFPFAVRIHAHDERDASSGSARVYSWNTVGSIVGAVGAGFFLVPAIGFAGSMTVAVGTNLLLALFATTRLRPLPAGVAAVSSIGLLLLAFFNPATPYTLLSTSPLTGRPAGGDLFHFAVGRSSTVMVRDRTGFFTIFTNGMQEAIVEPPGATLALSQLAPWMASLPTLLRPDARSVLVVGLGGGGAVEAMPRTIERIDVVELEPEVVEANRRMAAGRSIDPLVDPRVELTANDARGALLLTDRRYDAIVSQPSHPWTAGASHLYSREFFQVARDRLRDGGVMVNWMGLGFVDDALLGVLIASMQDVFQHVDVYAPVFGGVLLVASDEPFDLRGGAERALADDPEGFLRLPVLRPEDVVAARVVDSRTARKRYEGAEINTDERNLLQTRSPAIARRKQVTVDLEELALANAPLGESATPDPLALVRSLLRLRYPARAERFVDTLRDERAQAGARALIAAERDSPARARAAFAEALRLSPNDDALKFAAVAFDRRALKRGDENVVALAKSLRDPHAAVVEGWLRVDAIDAVDDARLLPLLPRLEACELGAACFEGALRLRARALLADPSVDGAHNALDLLDRYGALLTEREDYLLRARAAAAAGETRAALAMLFLVERGRRDPRTNQQVGRVALDVIRGLPEASLDPQSQKMAKIFRRLATSQRSRR